MFCSNSYRAATCLSLLLVYKSFIFHDRKWRTVPTYLRKCLFVYRSYFSEFYKEYPSFSIDTEATKYKPHIGVTPSGTLGKHYSIISDENCIKLIARYRIGDYGTQLSRYIHCMYINTVSHDKHCSQSVSKWLYYTYMHIL